MSHSNPQFSHLLTSSLGSPFLTTSDHNPRSNSSFVRAASEPPNLSLPPLLTRDMSRPSTPPARPNSPSPSTAGYSIIGVDEADESSEWFTYKARTPYRAFGSLGRRGHSTPTLSYFGPSAVPSSSPNGSFKSLLPRLWDVIVSSPSKANTRPQLTASNSRHTIYNFSPMSSPIKKGKEKSSYKKDIFANGEYGGHVDYIALPPLDDDDGELIDDEACFVAVDFWGVGIDSGRARAVTGMDILSLLPQELALHILVLVASHSHPLINAVLTSPQADYALDSLQAVLACLSVSRNWRTLASDNAVWRALFVSRWGNVNDKKIEDYLIRHQSHRKQGLQIRKPLKPRESPMSRRSISFTGAGGKSVFQEKKLPPLPPDADIETSSQRSRTSSLASIPNPDSPAPLTLNWCNLYRERLELERRWTGTAHVALSTQSSRSSMFSIPSRSSSPDSSSQDEKVRVREKWEPKMFKISGHKDSVYCLEFTSHYIITGSRDRTIKVWSQKSGRCLGTFGRRPGDNWDDEFPGTVNGHQGSVLCLKLLLEESTGDDSHKGVKRGVMYSGSSDCKVFVWDVYTKAKTKSLKRRASPWGHSRDRRIPEHDSMSDSFEEEYEVKAKVRSVLRGHAGGVLDLRVDDKWIVSCSKDAAIRVWNRQTEELHRTLRGHEGPVNAVGLEGGRVVSASGDGKMILWDIETGERLRTLDGHDRGLACIEFKDGLIVSGSNDCKIKIWSAATGECLRTLVGHEALVRALAFDPRSGRLVSASYDKTVRVWDVASGNTVQEFRNIHSSHIFDVKFDASRIVSAAHDHNIVVLDLGHGIASAPLFL